MVGKKTFLFESLEARLRHFEKEKERTRNVSLATSQLVINLTSNNNIHTYDKMRYLSQIIRVILFELYLCHTSRSDGKLQEIIRTTATFDTFSI